MKRSFGSPPLVGALVLVSSVVLLVAYHLIFVLFHRYDWQQPFVKLACFEALAALVVVLALWRPGREPEAPRWVISVELAVAGGILVWEVVRAVHLFREGLGADMNDLGTTTEEAARLLFAERKNPFSQVVAPIGDDPKYFGYKYGPTMVFAYALGGVWKHGVGIKISNAIFLAALVGVVAYLGGWAAARPSGAPPSGASASPRLTRATAAAWACALALLPERFYFESFHQGAQDVFPILLVLISIALVERESWLLAGLTAGLSFSSRFAPGVFLLLLFVRRTIPLRLAVGVALGMLPFVPFLIWDGPALVRNVFLFHSFKTFDSTSLYSVTPAELHPLFSVFQAVAAAVAVAIGFRRRLEARELVVLSTLLLIAIEISYREMHGNHLIWFMPLAGLVFTWDRHALGRLVAAKPA